jgi:hypothetical protein
MVVDGFRIDMGDYLFRAAQAPAGKPATNAETDSFELGSADHHAENLAPAVAVDVDGDQNAAIAGIWRGSARARAPVLHTTSTVRAARLMVTVRPCCGRR